MNFEEELKALLCDPCLARLEAFQARLLLEKRETVLDDAAQYELCPRCNTKMHEWIAGYDQN